MPVIRLGKVLAKAGFLALFLVAAVRAGAAEDPSAVAKFVTQSAQLNQGMCLNLGDADGTLTAALAAQSKLVVQGCTWNPKQVKAAHDVISRAGCLERASNTFIEVEYLPYADNLVNLVVSAAWGEVPCSAEEIARVLAPGGSAILGNDQRPTAVEGLAEKLKQAGIKEVQMLSRKGWCKFVKPANPDHDAWPHRLGGADLSSVNNDKIAGPWEEIRWVGDPRWGALYLSYLGRVTAGGRMYYKENRAAAGGGVQAWLVARDAYNGLELWRVPNGPAFKQSYYAQDETLTCDEQRVYTVEESGLLVRDGRTGVTLKIFAPGFTPLAVTSAGTALLASSKAKAAALDKETGKLLWSRPSACHPPAEGNQAFVFAANELEAVDLLSGSTRWKTKAEEAKGDAQVFSKSDVVYVVRKVPYKPVTSIAAFDAKNGAQLWKQDTTSGGYALLPYKDELWLLDRDNSKKSDNLSAQVLDPRSSAKKRAFTAKGQVPGHCYAPKGTGNFLLYGDSWYLDRKSEASNGLDTVRSPCRLGQMPANGLTYFFPHHCDCGVTLRGLLGLAPRGTRRWPVEDGKPQVFTAGAAPAPLADTPGDWPMYRKDTRRSNATTASLPEQVKQLWSVSAGKSKLTQATLAYGLAFAAEPAAQTVFARDAATGKEGWTFVADGRVEYPPALHQGLCIFSTHAGSVYALEARTGREVWRLRAAPTQKFIAEEGRFASVWPVIGGVMPMNGELFFSCGRSASVDGGIWIFCVEAVTGQVRWRTKGGTCGDLFLSDGTSLMLTEVFYQLKTGAKHPAAKNLGGLLHTTNYLSQVSIADYMACVEPHLSSNKHIELTNGSISGENLAFNEQLGVAAWRYRFGVPASLMKKDKQDKRFIYGSAGKSVSWCLDDEIKQQMVGVVLAGDKAYLAGVPVSQDPQDKSELWILAAGSGKKLQTVNIDGRPVYDGLSAAQGRLYVSTEDGKLICLGQ